MAEEGAPKAGYFETQIHCPQGVSQKVAYISQSKAQHFAKYGPAHKLHELKTLVRETLVDPHRIYAYNTEEFPGYCYVRACANAWTNNGARVEPPEGMIFVVFVTDTFKVIEWGWEYHDRDDRYRPMVHEGRLEAKVWSRD